ncbi:hemoglobin, alpha embryonic 5 isoform X1 [Gadus chalcogrammus]|uniref:hemoglobin, alpha embryonic 5 isoform X1 n=1 Tax=Gadus chalcogrammus TaxID=1042646 RepID=UPI0024C4887B|nr:hemoglobin, alpha embryonic 5 isoform X1 [Gadus chalcogrammus]
MSLSAKQKATVKDFFSKMSTRSDDIGAEALSRLVAVYPQTKSYFAHWKEATPGSAPVRKHGITIMGGVYDAVGKIDDLKGGLLSLSELHAFMLRVDPVNFKVGNHLRYLSVCGKPFVFHIVLMVPLVLRPPQLLAHCMLVCMSMIFPEEFTPQVHVAVDKFLAQLALALCEKYR